MEIKLLNIMEIGDNRKKNEELAKEEEEKKIRNRRKATRNGLPNRRREKERDGLRKDHLRAKVRNCIVTHWYYLHKAERVR